MWANMLPGRCASLNMSKNNLPACLIAKPRGLAALLQWDKYCTTQFRDTWAWGMPGWHTLRLNLLVLHSLPCAENLAHTLLPWPNLTDTEVKGPHKTRQMQFGKGRAWEGSARHILMQQGWGRDGPNQPEHGWGQRDEFKPSPAKPLCSYPQHKEQLCLGK